jgi:hypothetical protein
MRISLAKNSSLFHKLPTGKFGLLEWYPNAKPLKASKTADDEAGAEDANGDDEKGASE